MNAATNYAASMKPPPVRSRGEDRPPNTDSREARLLVRLADILAEAGDGPLELHPTTDTALIF